MPLLSYDPMADGNTASANLWNVRLSKIHDLLNGNLDAANLADGAVTTPKIADGAVTSPKLNLNSGIDDNGWSYYSLGNYKYYVKSQSWNDTPAGQLATGAYRYGIGSMLMPVGVDKNSTFWMGCTYTSGIQHMLKPYWLDTTHLATMAWNVGPSEYVLYDAYWMIIQKV